MATWFLVHAPDPNSLFPQIQQWAQSNGFLLQGDATKGVFAGTPGGLAGIAIGRISGSYSVSGPQVVMQTAKSLPEGEVARRLRKFGLRLVESR